MRHTGYLIAALAAAAAPWLWPLIGAAQAGDPAVSSPEAARFPGWPDRIDGRPVTRAPLEPDEATFAAAFPGRVARFDDGERHHILRWVREPTRRLHPASHCLRASGYRLSPERLCRGETGTSVCYRATRGSTSLDVHEHLYDETGRRWPHVSEWYWAASLGQSEGPWWSRTTFRAVSPTAPLPGG